MSPTTHSRSSQDKIQVGHHNTARAITPLAHHTYTNSFTVHLLFTLETKLLSTFAKLVFVHLGSALLESAAHVPDGILQDEIVPRALKGLHP